MTDDHKKILEILLNCKLYFSHSTVCYEECYNLKFNNNNRTTNMWFNPETNWFVVNNFYLNKIIEINEVFILHTDTCFVYFMFLSDLKNVDI